MGESNQTIDPSIPTPKRSWNMKLRGHKLAVMWFLIAIVGMVLISITSGAPRMIIPIVLLLIYAFYGYKYVQDARDLMALRQARVGQLADSLYFLGFLWTLYALIDAFVIHHISIAEAVFRAFGYALVTTATGMFFRLFLLQFGYLEEEQVQVGERTAEEEIARFSKILRGGSESVRNFQGEVNELRDYIRELKKTVDETNVEMSRVSTALAQTNKENIERVDKHIQNALDEFVKKLEPAITEVLEQVRSELLKTSKSFERASAKTEEVLDTKMKNLESSLNSLSEQLQQIQLPPDIVEKILTDEFGKVGRKLEGAAKAFEESVSLVSKQIGEIHVPTDIVEKTFGEEIRKQVEGIHESMKLFEEDVRKFSKGIGDLKLQPDVFEKTLDRHIASTLSGVEPSVKSLLDTMKKLENAALATPRQVSSESAKPIWKFWGK